MKPHGDADPRVLCGCTANVNQNAHVGVGERMQTRGVCRRCHDERKEETRVNMVCGPLTPALRT